MLHHLQRLLRGQRPGRSSVRRPAGRGEPRPCRLELEALESRTLLDGSYVANQLLIHFDPGAAEAARAEARGWVGAVLKEQVATAAMQASGYGALELVTLPADVPVEAAARALRNHPAVLFAEPNRIYTLQEAPNDPYYTNGSLWGMYGDATSPANQYGSQAGEAWAQGNTGSNAVYVGIIDSGVDYNHTDLAPNFWTNPFDPVGDSNGDGNPDDDGNGYADDVRGYDFVNGDSDPMDDHSHGTHVAGTIGAVGGNGQGVAGVNWHVTMIAAKIFDAAGLAATTDQIVKAFDYFTDLKTRHGLNIVATNNSWGGNDPYSQALHDAIIRAARADILTIAAAGNGGSDGLGDDNDATPFYPANFDTTQGTSTEGAASYDGVIAVTAINKSGALPSLFGIPLVNHGATTVDLAAPGEGIYSTMPGGGYGTKTGTSMAAPHVTGAAALYAAAHPGASARDIREAILANTIATASLSGKTVTGGRLNVSSFFAAPPPSAPTLSISDVAVTEGSSGTVEATFTVTLSAPASADVTVNYATANNTAAAGSDYTAASGGLTFRSALGETSKTITVLVNGDGTYEPNETFFVNLSGASGATVADGQGQGSILNDDGPPTISIGDVSLAEGNRGNKAFVFTVTLSNPSSQTITVRYATANGTATTNNKDYTAASGTLTFNPGETSKTITISVRGDTRVEPNEAFYVNLSSPSNAALADSQGLGTILDDDGTGGARLTASSGGVAPRFAEPGQADADLLFALLGPDDLASPGAGRRRNFLAPWADWEGLLSHRSS